MSVPPPVTAVAFIENNRPLVSDIIDMIDILCRDTNGDVEILNEIEQRTNEMQQVIRGHIYHYGSWPSDDDVVNDLIRANWGLVEATLLKVRGFLEMANGYGIMDDVAVELEQAWQIRWQKLTIDQITSTF